MKQQVKISKVKGNPSNPRIIKNDKFNKLKNSIKTLPNYMKLRPVIVDEDMMVLGGNMRLKASIDLGKKEIWTDMFTQADCDEMNEIAIEEKRETKTYLEYCDEIIIKDNVSSGDWEWDMLANEWDSVQLNDFGLDVWENLDDKEPEAGLIEDDEIPEVKESKVKRGDIWQLGEHRVMCGDSTSSDDVDKLMNGEKADMVFTDPPYDLDNDSWLDICIKKNKDAEHIILGSDKQTIRYCSAYNDMFKNFYIIHYKQFNWNLSKYTPILTHIVVSHLRNKDKKHIDLKGLHSLLEFPSIRDYTIMSHSKRLECLIPFINVFSTKLVLDVFLGSGSTLIACEKTNRICYGMELDEKYCDVIIERWEQFTGQKAIKNGTK
jgi:DNA modification methylase